jgi:hypothetical protein
VNPPIKIFAQNELTKIVLAESYCSGYYPITPWERFSKDWLPK